MRKTAFVSVVGILLAACDTVPKLNPDAINRNPPQYFTDRVFFKRGAEVFGTNLDTLVGRIARTDPQGQLIVTGISTLRPGQRSETKVIQPSPEVVFESNYTNSSSAQAVVPFGINANVGTDAVRRIRIQDVARAIVPVTDFPDQARVRGLLGIATNSPLPEGYYWIEGAVLTSITTTEYKAGQGGLTIGPGAFSIDGKTKISDNVGTGSYSISVLMHRLTDLGTGAASSASPPLAAPSTALSAAALLSSRPQTVVIDARLSFRE
jgi:hypothetical protein